MQVFGRVCSESHFAIDEWYCVPELKMDALVNNRVVLESFQRVLLQSMQFGIQQLSSARRVRR